MPESVLIAVICVPSVTFYFWSRSYLKRKAAEIGKAEAYRRNQAVSSGIAFPAGGVVMIGIAVFNWNSMPAENRDLAVAVIGTGVALILYGIYKTSTLPRK